ncbi:MAG: alpha/beta hydrolase [Thermodesulfobacteriota bacterium]|nr:alpha/beta hydrolase [Thermodesulfobacteriota bacterium]
MRIISIIFFIVFGIQPAFAGDVEIRTCKNIPYLTNAQEILLQSLDIYSPQQKTPQQKTVVIFIHGGGWTTGDKGQKAHIAKKDFFVRNNIVFVSINYRMAPQYSFPAYPQDVAAAISYVIDNIDKYGGNPNDVFLSGHSAGGHLAALVSTDARYLKAYGKDLKDIRGVILLDGAGYNIPGRFESFGSNKERKWVRKMYKRAFGTNPALWKDASPIKHVEAEKNIPSFLVFYVVGRKEAEIQSREFVSALKDAKVPTKLVPIENSSHRKINVSFGAQSGLKEKETLDFIGHYDAH